MKKPLRAFLSVLAAPLGAGACQHATPAPLDIGNPAPALGVAPRSRRGVRRASGRAAGGNPIGGSAEGVWHRR